MVCFFTAAHISPPNPPQTTKASLMDVYHCRSYSVCHVRVVEDSPEKAGTALEMNPGPSACLGDLLTVTQLSPLSEDPLKVEWFPNVMYQNMQREQLECISPFQ